MGFNLRQYCADLDSMLAPSMPSSWLGHARVRIHERGFETEKQRTFAEKVAAHVVENHDISAERAAELAIEKAEERFQ